MVDSGIAEEIPPVPMANAEFGSVVLHLVGGLEHVLFSDILGIISPTSIWFDMFCRKSVAMPRDASDSGPIQLFQLHRGQDEQHGGAGLQCRQKIHWKKLLLFGTHF